MYTYQKKSLPKKTTELIIDIPKVTIEKERELAFKKLQEKLTAPGYRQGKTPKSVAKKYIKNEQVYEQLIKDLLPKIYQELIQKENLRPIVSPKIELTKAKEGEDWQIKITVAEKPEVNLNEYREKIKKIKAEEKKADIWLPGQTKEKKEDEKEKNQRLLNKILQGLLANINCEISDLILEDELNHRLTQLLDEVQKLGLTIEAYLKSKNTTIEALKSQIKKEIEDTYKLEFILQEIADKEGITVEKNDLEKIYNHIQNPKEKELAQQNSYFYSMILRKQKTLDFLLNL